jgi:hypothetical protein
MTCSLLPWTIKPTITPNCLYINWSQGTSLATLRLTETIALEGHANRQGLHSRGTLINKDNLWTHNAQGACQLAGITLEGCAD